MRWSCWSACCLLAGLSGAPAAAQDLPQYSQDLPQYWDALEAASAVTELTPPASDGGVKEGLYLLRRWELGRDRTDAFLGRRALERLIAREPRNAWAHFALGALLARGPDLRTALGEDRRAYVAWQYSLAALRAPRSLRRALALDPSLHPAALALGRLALDLGDHPLMGESLKALQRAGGDTLAAALALRSELLLVLGEARRSAALADSAARRGADPSVAAHLRAAALFGLEGSEAEGARVYFEGVAALTPVGARTYYDAVSALISPAERAAWQTADLAGRRAWLERFWRVQAGLAGVPLEERLAEHFARLLQVRRDGRVARMGAGAALGAFDAREYGVPSMGMLTLLRHGDPDRVDKVLFCGTDILELPLPLQPSVDDCRRSPMGRHRARGANRLVHFQAQDAATPGASYYPDFDQHLTLTWDVLQFRAPMGATRVVAAVGVPTADAGAFLHGDEILARAELFLVDTVAGIVVHEESVRRFAAGPLPPAGWMLLQVQLDSRTSRERPYRLGVTDRLRRAGAIVGGSIAVRDYAGGGLMLSDLVLAPLDAGGSFERGAHRIALAPGREFRRTESLALYYELYGLAAGDAYRTEIAIEPQPEGVLARMRSLFPGAPETLRLSFDEEADTVHEVYGVQQLRTVGLDGLLPGTYRMRVTVTDARARSTVQERVLYVGTGERE